jgi:pyrimidine-nucleoside phosphorylase
MHFQEILTGKRDRRHLSKEEIQFFVDGYTKGEIPDYQASAFLMSCFLNGLSIDETVWLTEAMLHSGIVVDLGEVPGIKVDKHSTGGVGDKTSLIIAPICAAVGVPVPMISGRGLGHTGGTLDKLEAIPGFNVNLGLDEYRSLIKEIGCCLIGQTQDIAPADKKMYALRDVTCTVENKSLISASIMSKKLAEGIDALVLDVKAGSGAFMKSEADAEELARLMMSIGKKMGKRVTALITDMNQTLGSYVGNSLEVIESVDILKGKALPEQKDLLDLSLLLAAHMIILGGKTENLDLAMEIAQKSISDGSAFGKLKEIVNKQGGDPSSLDDISKLPTARESHLMKADKEGYMSSLDALLIGKGALYLGAGRITLDSVIDPGVGIIVKKKVGDPVKAGETILEVRFNDEKKLQDGLVFLKESISISESPVAPLELVKKTITQVD